MLSNFQYKQTLNPEYLSDILKNPEKQQKIYILESLFKNFLILFFHLKYNLPPGGGA